MNGRCMCGAVTVAADALDDRMSACHCEMCRRWTGTAFVAVHAKGSDVTLTGPIKTVRLSTWAARGWCDDCGSTLFYNLLKDGSYGLSAGLFDNAADRQITHEYYHDHKPDGWAFSGDHTRMTRRESLEFFGISEGDIA